MNEIKVYDSLNRILRNEESFEYDIIRESVYLLNVAGKIEPKYISKELKILIRNLNSDEIDYCYKTIKDEIIDVFSMDYDKLVKYLEIFDCTKGEIENIFQFVNQVDKINTNDAFRVFNYIYARSIYDNSCLNKDIKIMEMTDYSNIDDFAEEVARDICSKLIVVEIKDYKYLYSILRKYYNMGDSLVKINFLTNKFIMNFINLCNILFLGTDSHRDDLKFNFVIKEIEERKIIREIYAYRSCITHGDYCGYKNSIYKLEKLLKYEENQCVMNRVNDIECLISRKLNFYIKTIFEVNSKNTNIINLLKN